jgi:hypothetical protein
MFNKSRVVILIFISLHLASCSSWSENPILAKTAVVKGDELDSIRTLFSSNDTSCTPSITVLRDADTFKYDMTSSVDTNVNIIQVTLPQENGQLSTHLSLSKSMGTYVYAGEITDTLLCEQSKDYWFLAWFNEPFYKPKIAGSINKHHRYELHIRAIDKRNGRELLNQMLYTTTCCINSLDMHYNQYTSSLLYAFNDFGGRNVNLMYGFIKFDNSNNAQVRKPRPVRFKDDTDKRQPMFIDNGTNAFLYHTTGDSWGFAGQIGKQEIGVFRIDSTNGLTEHKTIFDEEEVNEKILMLKDTVYYRLGDNNQFDRMTIKKIAWDDLAEY